ncbi:MAG: NUDIX hydrolase [Saprospiraceae bacterium]
MKVDIHKEELILDDFFSIYKANLKFEHFDGSMSKDVERYTIQKGDAVAVLVFHIDRKEYILVKQFRYPPVNHDVDAWLTEIVAGGMEDGEDELQAAEREVVEEIGYKPIRLHRIAKCYVSPGIMNERVTIFVADINDSSKQNNGGGVKGEDEDIQLVWIPQDEADQWLWHQEVGDAKTIIAMQWHLLQSGLL